MSSAYELGILTVAPVTAAAYCTLHTGATRRARIWEITVTTTAGTASSVGVGKPANTPVATTSTLVQALDSNDPAGTVNLDTAWSTAPTVPAQFWRRFAIPATSGSGFTWIFQRPLIVPVSSWICLWNFGAATAAICAAYFSIDEE